MSCHCPPSTSRRIYEAALPFLGTKEVSGKESNPLIKQWIHEAATWLDGDDSATAWCGCFRGHLGLITATGVPKEHFRAASWAKWGNAIDVTRPETWEQGDSIVMTRQGGNHVCLFHGRSKTAASNAWRQPGRRREHRAIPARPNHPRPQTAMSWEITEDQAVVSQPAEGFRDIHDLRAWFEANHNLPFDGELIKWK